MIYRIDLTIETRGPLLVGKGARTRDVVRSYDFIPGSVIRGALGAVIASGECVYSAVPRNHDECEQRFDCLYYRIVGPEHKIALAQFHNAYKLCEHGEPSSPVPRYWRKCKLCDAYRNLVKDFVRYGFIQPRVCDGGEEEEIYEEVDGFGCFHENGLSPVPIDLRRITRTAIKLDSSTAEEGTLHSLEAIAEGQKFGNHITIFPEIGERKLQDRDVERLVDYTKVLEDEGLGAAKSRGFGDIGLKVDIREISDQEIRGKAEELTEILKKSNEIFESAQIVLNLTSPLIPNEKSVGGLDAPTLSAYMRKAHELIFRPSEPKTPEIEVKSSIVRPVLRGGWSLEEGRRKAVVVAFSAGSSIFIQAAPNQHLAECLTALELINSGRFKSAGCGELKVEVVT